MSFELYCTKRELTSPSGLEGFNFSPLTEEERLSRLDALFSRIQESQERTTALFALLRHLDRAHHALRVDLDSSALGRLSAWLEGNLAVVRLESDEVLDARGRLLFSPARTSDPSAFPPRSPEAEHRRRRSATRLKSAGLILPTDLPLVTSESELHLRDPLDVARRSLALLLVALSAESAAGGERIPTLSLQERRPRGFEQLSPQEREYLENSNPHPEEHIPISWRYEALLALLWALNLQELPPASELCDSARMVEMMLDQEEQEMLERAVLRPPSVLLDALDLAFCQHWAVRQAELQGGPTPPGIDPGVAYERHYALSWLTRFEPHDWDDICTPT